MGKGVCTQCGYVWILTAWFLTTTGHPFPPYYQEDQEDQCKAWVRALAAELKPYKTDSTYINMFNVPQEEKDKIPITEFFGTHAARVKEIKLKWDPKNVFQAQTNILKMA